MAESGATTSSAPTRTSRRADFEKTAKIVGRFEGTITGKGELNVVNDAECKADVSAAVANIDGRLRATSTQTTPSGSTPTAPSAAT